MQGSKGHWKTALSLCQAHRDIGKQHYARITGVLENSVDPDHIPLSAASDQGLPCLFR